ncbi:MAG: c-type cytochrome [Pseudomonadota bacterium]
MTGKIYWAVWLATGVALAACDGGPKSGRGFTLPEGDIAAGEAAFVQFHCTDCHAVAGRDDLREGVDPVMTVTLGGRTTRIQTYGQLVTSVINPSHKISQKYIVEGVAVGDESVMRKYNDVMTVSEMTDIVAFLQEQYELEPFTPTTYYGYSYQ